VYVDLKGELTAGLPKPGVAQLTYRGGGVDVVPGDGRMYFYVRPGNRGPLRPVGSGTPRLLDARTVAVTVRYPDPSPEQTDRFVSCTIGQLAEGYGHPSPSDPECGPRTLEATEQRRNAPG
jgi:hypothetical protein